MNVELLAVTENAEQLIETAGRNCYNSQKNDPSIIRAWIDSGHESVIEHSVATFSVSGASRALMAQLTRHRLASYSIRSQRYCSESKFEYVTPDAIAENIKAAEIFALVMANIQAGYDELISYGIKKEDARAILPNATTTKIIFTMNFRELRNFLKLRLDTHAQAEIKTLANKCLSLVKPIAPNVFYDFEVCDE